MKTTLPGTLHGLLRPGSIVLFDDVAKGRTLKPAIVLDGPDADGDFDITTFPNRAWDPVILVGADRLALNLSEASGRDRAARWMADCLCRAAGVCAPTWASSDYYGGHAWTLSGDGWIVIFVAHPTGLRGRLDSDTVGVPDLRGDTDPVEALVLACLALSSLPETPDAR